MITLLHAWVPERTLVLQSLDHRLVIHDGDPLIQSTKPGGVREQVGKGHVLLAGADKFGPDLTDRRVQGQPRFLERQQGAHGGRGFRG